MAVETVSVKDVNSVYVKLFFLVSDKPGTPDAHPKYITSGDKVFEDLFGYTGENLVSKLARVTNGAEGIINILNNSIGFNMLRMLMEDRLYWNVIRELVSMDARYKELKSGYKKRQKNQKKTLKKFNQYSEIASDESLDSRERSRYRIKANKMRESIEKDTKQGKKMQKEGRKIKKEYKKAIEHLQRMTGIEKVKAARSSSSKGSVSFAACRELANHFKSYGGVEYYQDDVSDIYNSDFGADIAQFIDEDGFDYEAYNLNRRKVQNYAVQLEDERRQATSRRKNEVLVVPDEDDDDEGEETGYDRLAEAIENQNQMMLKLMRMMINNQNDGSSQQVNSYSEDDEDEAPLIQYKKPPKKDYTQEEYDAIDRQAREQFMAAMNGTYSYEGPSPQQLLYGDNSEEETPKASEPKKIIQSTQDEEVENESTPEPIPQKKIQPVVEEESAPVVQEAPKKDLRNEKIIPTGDAEEVDLSDHPDWMIIDLDFSKNGMPIKPIKLTYRQADDTDEIKELIHQQMVEQRRNGTAITPKIKEYVNIIREKRMERAAYQNKKRMERYEQMYAEWAAANPELAKEKEESDKKLGIKS